MKTLTAHRRHSHSHKLGFAPKGQIFRLDSFVDRAIIFAAAIRDEARMKARQKKIVYPTYTAATASRCHERKAA